MLGWILVVVGVVFGVLGGAANVLLAQNYAEFWTVSLPVAIIGIVLGGYCLERGREQSGAKRRVVRS